MKVVFIYLIMANFGTRFALQSTVKNIQLDSEDLIKLHKMHGNADQYIVVNKQFIVASDNEPEDMPIMFKQVTERLQGYDFISEIEITEEIPDTEEYQKYRNHIT